MAIEDLDLEFEDEEEIGKKGDALDVDVDLTFSASPESEVGQAVQSMQQGKPLPDDEASAPKPRPRPRPKAKAPAPKPRPTAKAVELEEDIEIEIEIPSNVENIETARRPRQENRPVPTQQVAKPSAAPTNYANNSEVSADVATLKLEIEELKNQMQKVQHHADIRVAVAESEKNYLIEYVSNAKIMDHQITGVLEKVSAKVPQLKREMQAIKKYLTDFVEKSGNKK